MESKVRLITKYPNRRLYDTNTSTYITLADVKQLVLDQDELQIIDARTGDDLTRQVLLHVILEQESAGSPIFSSDLLLQLIRSYGSAMHAMMSGFLERNIRAFDDMQNVLHDHAPRIHGDKAASSHDLWTQFMQLEGPAMHSFTQAYLEESEKVFAQMSPAFGTHAQEQEPK